MSLDMFPDAAIKHILDSEAEREARELQIQGDPEGVLRRTLQRSTTDARADFEAATRSAVCCGDRCHEGGCPQE